MTLLLVLLASLVIMSASLVGVIVVWQRLGKWTERNLKFLISFAAGVFLVISYNLAVEAFESHLETSTLLLWLLAGIILAHLINYLIPDTHHHHGAGEEIHSHSKAGAKRIMFSDAFHNIIDGFLLAPAFLLDIRLGILTTAGIFVHELAQEISEFFVLRSAGYNTKRALLLNFSVSSTILIGSLGGFFLASSSESITGALLALAAGAFTYTVLRDLIPHSITTAHKEKEYAKHLIAVLLGITLIFFVNSQTSETHSHDDDHEEDHVEELHDDELISLSQNYS